MHAPTHDIHTFALILYVTLRVLSESECQASLVFARCTPLVARRRPFIMVFRKSTKAMKTMKAMKAAMKAMKAMKSMKAMKDQGDGDPVSNPFRSLPSVAAAKKAKKAEAAASHAALAGKKVKKVGRKDKMVGLIARWRSGENLNEAKKAEQASTAKGSSAKPESSSESESESSSSAKKGKGSLKKRPAAATASGKSGGSLSIIKKGKTPVDLRMDRNKKYHFDRLKAANGLPEYLTHMLENAPKALHERRGRVGIKGRGGM